MATCLVIYANGSEDIEVTTQTDILTRGGVKVTKAALCDEGTTVTLAHGTKVICDANLEDCKDSLYDLIVIPGGLDGSIACRDSATLIKMLKAQKARGAYIGAICAAPGFVLGTHGIIGENDLATGYPGCTDTIKNLSTVGVVVNKEAKIITGKGPAFSFAFGYAMLEALMGKEVCDKVKDGMLYTD